MLAQFDDGVAAIQAENYGGALEAFTKAGDDPRAQYSIGYLYQFGLGVPADLGKAKEWYDKAAAGKNPDALYALGLLYETGKSGRKDLAEAMKDYRAAADSGQSPDAEYAVGRMILRGRGVPRDPVEGVKWLRKAANHNQVAALYMMGAAYEAGWGVAPDPAEAYYWYRRSQLGDQVELAEHDMSFEPKIAIDALKRRLSAETIRQLEARVKAASAAPKAAEKVKAKKGE